MLKEISIRDIVLIDALDLEIGAGFTALTGETGAGKSILLDALGLALGARADKSLVRNGSSRAIAAARFEISQNHIANEILRESEIDINSNEVVLRRTLNNDGKSRAFINDIPVSVNLLYRISNSLLEVHGQHSAIGLMDANNHINSLDNFLAAHIGQEFSEALKQTFTAFNQLNLAQKALEDAIDRMGKSGAERDYLAHVFNELEKLNPIQGEELELDKNRRFLMGSERVNETLKEALEAIEGGKIENNLSAAARAISKIGLIEGENGQKLNLIIEAAAEALEKAQNEVSEAQNHLHQLGYAIDLDPKELERLEERLFALRAAARKHNVSVDDLIIVKDKAAAELKKIDNCDEELIKAKEAKKIAEQKYLQYSQNLSHLRKDGALDFSSKIMAELAPLKLEKMRFQVAFDNDFNGRTSKGIDKISFEIAPNIGAGFGSLSQIASGGELSRLSLALKVVLAGAEGTLALVFDEVDQGIGGATAEAVGKRLQTLAKSAQVLCVTHSPQVAACADYHYKIQKNIIDNKTLTNVVPLSVSEREEELARMLAGETISDEARAAARTLIANNRAQ